MHRIIVSVPKRKKVSLPHQYTNNHDYGHYPKYHHRNLQWLFLSNSWHKCITKKRPESWLTITTGLYLAFAKNTVKLATVFSAEMPDQKYTTFRLTSPIISLHCRAKITTPQLTCKCWSLGVVLESQDHRGWRAVLLPVTPQLWAAEEVTHPTFFYRRRTHG